MVMSVVWIYHILFIHSSGDCNFGVFLVFLAIMCFMCLAICIHCLIKCPFKSFAHICFLHYFLFICYVFLYIAHSTPLPDIGFANIFS